MEVYFRAFVNGKQNNWAKLLSIANYAYNNTKNTSISHTPFKLNCNYHTKILFEDKANPHLRSCSTNKLAKKLRELIEIYYQNLLYA